MISRHLGDTSSTMSIGHFSIASWRTVWLVKAKTFFEISSAWSKSRPFSSTKTLINSAIAMFGWVSFSWMT